MNANCERFEHWLDAGRPEADSAGHAAHAAGCPRCAALLSLEDALLASAPMPAPAGFTALVMSRIDAAQAERLEAWLSPADFALPWWARAAAHPAAVLAMAAGAAVAWGHAPLWALANALSQRTLALLQLPVPRPGEDLAVSLVASLPAGLGGAAALLAVAAPLLLLAGWALYAGTEHLARRFA